MGANGRANPVDSEDKRWSSMSVVGFADTRLVWLFAFRWLFGFFLEPEIICEVKVESLRRPQ